MQLIGGQMRTEFCLTAGSQDASQVPSLREGRDHALEGTREARVRATRQQEIVGRLRNSISDKQLAGEAIFDVLRVSRSALVGRGHFGRGMIEAVPPCTHGTGYHR